MLDVALATSFAGGYCPPLSCLACCMFGTHQGTWVYGKRHGNGSYTYHDGGKYDGEWVDDKVRSAA